MNIQSQLKQWDLTNQRVILRADLNVPLHNNAIANDFRLRAIQPTLDYLLKQRAYITLITHLGRPHNTDPLPSTAILIPWFTQRGYKITFSPTVTQALQQQKNKSTPCILLENIRSFSGELTDNISFARELAQLGDYYVTDAFGVLHRTNTSVTLLARQFTPLHRTIGFLVEKELHALDSLLYNPAHPFCLIIGGSKISDKLPMLEHLLSKINTLLLCPPFSFSFLKARNIAVGKSLVDDTMVPLCMQILEKARTYNVEVIFPVDYQIAYNARDGQRAIVDAHAIPSNAFGISIGSKTEILFTQKIHESKTIFFNGAMGFLQQPDTLHGMYTILQAIAQSHGTSIIAGEHSVSIVDYFGMANAFDFLSTGGGSTLMYLSNQELPGLKAIYS